jgi:hypothetical protein
MLLVPALFPEPPELVPPMALGGASAAVEHANIARQRVAVETSAKDFMGSFLRVSNGRMAF